MTSLGLPCTDCFGFDETGLAAVDFFVFAVPLPIAIRSAGSSFKYMALESGTGCGATFGAAFGLAGVGERFSIEPSVGRGDVTSPCDGTLYEGTCSPEEKEDCVLLAQVEQELEPP